MDDRAVLRTDRKAVRVVEELQELLHLAPVRPHVRLGPVDGDGEVGGRHSGIEINRRTVQVVRVVRDVVVHGEERLKDLLHREGRRIRDPAENVLEEPRLVRDRSELHEDVVPERLLGGERRLRVVRCDRVNLEREPHQARELLRLIREELLCEPEEIVHLRRRDHLSERIDEIGDRRVRRMERAVRQGYRRRSEPRGRRSGVPHLPVFDRVRIGADRPWSSPAARRALPARTGSAAIAFIAVSWLHRNAGGEERLGYRARARRARSGTRRQYP